MALSAKIYSGLLSLFALFALIVPSLAFASGSLVINGLGATASASGVVNPIWFQDDGTLIGPQNYVAASNYNAGVKLVADPTGNCALNSDDYATCISTDGGVFVAEAVLDTATGLFKTTTILGLSDITGIFSTIFSDTGAQMALIIAGVTAGIVALFGLGFLFRHLSRWIVGRKF